MPGESKRSDLRRLQLKAQMILLAWRTMQRDPFQTLRHTPRQLLECVRTLENKRAGCQRQKAASTQSHNHRVGCAITGGGAAALKDTAAGLLRPRMAFASPGPGQNYLGRIGGDCWLLAACRALALNLLLIGTSLVQQSPGHVKVVRHKRITVVADEVFAGACCIIALPRREIRFVATYSLSQPGARPRASCAAMSSMCYPPQLRCSKHPPHTMPHKSHSMFCWLFWTERPG